MITQEQFIDLIKTTYVVDNQEIFGLENLYLKIKSNDNSINLFNLIINKQNIAINTIVREFNELESILFKLIKETIRISNGDYSELWFAIIYDGKVKGGVAMDNITSDIIVGDQNISLKNYKEASCVNFGMLQPELMIIINNLLIVTSLLLEQPLNNSMTKNSVNKILNLLTDIELNSELSDFLTLSRLTNNKPLKSIAKLYLDILNGKSVYDLNKKICTYVNLLLLTKIHAVEWWAIIVNNHIYIKDSTTLYNIIKCKDNNISEVVSSFDKKNLFVNGNLIKKKIMELNIGME